MNKVDARRKNPFPTQKYDMRLALVADILRLFCFSVKSCSVKQKHEGERDRKHIIICFTPNQKCTSGGKYNQPANSSNVNTCAIYAYTETHTNAHQQCMKLSNFVGKKCHTNKASKI